MHAECRIDQRITHSLNAYIFRRGALEPVKVVEVSFRGLFVRTALRQAVRDLVKLRIDVPAREIVAHAVVARVVMDDASKVFGLGMAFFALRDRDKAEWEAFVQGLIADRRAA